MCFTIETNTKDAKWVNQDMIIVWSKRMTSSWYCFFTVIRLNCSDLYSIKAVMLSGEDFTNLFLHLADCLLEAERWNVFI